MDSGSHCIPSIDRWGYASPTRAGAIPQRAGRTRCLPGCGTDNLDRLQHSSRRAAVPCVRSDHVVG